jgi:hypothetical protein
VRGEREWRRRRETVEFKIRWSVALYDKEEHRQLTSMMENLGLDGENDLEVESWQVDE